ncbi:MAG: LacI family transcriptional regulator [Lachnospiraceae bacterium]|nr:LacI family transcriptional regulator [Lachnospiraceae bacterium]
MITLKDIAREAGVSITTVSNVVHKRKSRVSPEMVAKIQEIITRENYIPSMTARTLASNASPIIGVINQLVFQSDGGFLSDPFHNIFMGSLEAKMRDKGYFIMIRSVEDVRALETVHRNWNLAGMIFTGLFQNEFFDFVHGMDIPYVLIDSYIDLPEIYNVGLEDQKGGYMATKYLLEKGHRTVAFASPIIRRNGVVDQRLKGYKQALAEFGVPFDPALIYEQELSDNVSIDEGIKLGKILSTQKAVTGIFASADILAAGILTGLREKGVMVPADKSLVGFDDNYLCQITHPKLTTIHQDAEHKGVIAAEMMVSQLMKEPPEHQNIILPVRLVERESVRAV